jgi:hypothetical protein
MNLKEVVAAGAQSGRPTHVSPVRAGAVGASLGHLPQEVPMRWFRELALTRLVLAGVACSEPNGSSGPIGIQAELTAHDGGSFVMATIRSLSGERLRYSPCSYRIEQRDADGSWSAAYQDTRPCPALLQFLDGGTTREVELSLPAELPAGSYRIRFPEIGRSEDLGQAFTVAAQVGGEFSLDQ